jgi:hypothetical protein
MSEMRGTNTSISVSYQDGGWDSHTVGGEFGAKATIKKVVEVGGKGTYAYSWGSSADTTRDTTRTSMYEFTTSEMFEHVISHKQDTTISRTMDYSIGVPLPPHTQVMLRQGRSSLEAHIDYDYPVVTSYKVKVVALGSQRNGSTITNFMRPIATFGIDKVSGNEASHLEIDAAENFRVLWGFRNDPGRSNMHSTDTISLNRMWTQMKQVTGTVSNFSPSTRFTESKLSV